MADFKHIKGDKVVRTHGVSTGRIARRIRTDYQLKPGEAECTVCGLPGRPLPPDQDPRYQQGQAYRHEGRDWLCRTLGFWPLDPKLIGILTGGPR